MTNTAAGARRRVLLLTDSLGGFAGPAATVLRRHLVSKEVRAEVTEVDFFEQLLPNLAVLARLAYTQDASFLPGLVGGFAQALQRLPANSVLQALGAGGLTDVRALLSGATFDAVVATSSVAAAAVAETPAGSRPPLLFVLPSFSVNDQWIHPGCDLYFVATKEVRDELVMAGIPYSRVVVSGIPAHLPSAHEPRGVLRRSAGIADRFTVVVGGAGYAEADPAALAAALADRGIQVVGLPGRETRAARGLERLASSHALVTLADSALPCPAVLLGDVVLARAGGAVLLEATSVGVPAVVYNPVASQERSSTDFLVNVGAILLARDDEDALEKVRFLAEHPDRLAQMTSSAAYAGRNSAVKSISDRLTAFVR